MKKLLLLCTAIISLSGQIQPSWVSAAKMGAATLVANTPLMYAVWSHKVHSAALGEQVVDSIQNATAAGNAVTQRIESATAELTKFTPIMNLPAFHDSSSMSWLQWAGHGSKNFASHVISTVLTTIVIQVLMHTAMNTIQSVAISMIEKPEDNSQPRNVTPAAQAQQVLTPAEIARRKRVVNS